MSCRHWRSRTVIRSKGRMYPSRASVLRKTTWRKKREPNWIFNFQKPIKDVTRLQLLCMAMAKVWLPRTVFCGFSLFLRNRHNLTVLTAQINYLVCILGVQKMKKNVPVAGFAPALMLSQGF